jgi:hypothetical protein
MAQPLCATRALSGGRLRWAGHSRIHGACEAAGLAGPLEVTA